MTDFPPPLVTPGAGFPDDREPALEASVALLVEDSWGGVQVGSAILVAVGHRFLVATAAHNLEGIPSDRWIRVLPRGLYRGDPIRFAARSHGRWEGLDVAWIELEAAIVERRALAFLRLEDLASRPDGPAAVEAFEIDRLWVHGYGIHGVDPLGIRGTRFALEATTVRSVRIRPGEGEPVVGYRSHLDLAIAWPPPDLAVHVPSGLSGGAVWAGPGAGALVGLTRSWNRTRGLLFATRIEHWLRRVWAEIPDVRPAVESAL